MQMTVLNVPSKIVVVFYYNKFQTFSSFSRTVKMNDIPAVLITHYYGLGLALCCYVEILSFNKKKADIKQKL